MKKIQIDIDTELFDVLERLRSEKNLSYSLTIKRALEVFLRGVDVDELDLKDFTLVLPPSSYYYHKQREFHQKKRRAS